MSTRNKIGNKQIIDQHKNTNEEISSIILLISLLNLLIHLLSISFIRYGISGDELYYLACANRLDFGYVDHPPLSIWILSLWEFLFGNSLYVIRILPAIISSVTVFIIGLFTRKIGGSKIAVIIATITFTLSPIFLGVSTIYSMNVFDFFFWGLSAYIYLGIIHSGGSKLWYILGIVIGLGLLNNTSILLLSTGILAGTIFTPVRDELKAKHPYIAAGIAILIFSPYIIWNLTHDFAYIDYIKSTASSNYSNSSFVSSILDLFLILNPVSILIWLPGILFYFFNRDTSQYRAFGFIWLISLSVIFINSNSKLEYIAPSFLFPFASGALMILKWNRIINRLKYALVIPVVALGIILSPMTLPLLPVEYFMDYQSWLTLRAPDSERHNPEGLTRFCSDMFGWSDMAGRISEVYHSLPDEERKSAVVYCYNYSEAGAMEYYKHKYMLPNTICSQNSYWYWWNEVRNPTTVIIIGGRIKTYSDFFETVEFAGFYKPKYGMPYGNNLTIYICRGFKGSLEKVRRKDKIFI